LVSPVTRGGERSNGTLSPYGLILFAGQECWAFIAWMQHEFPNP